MEGIEASFLDGLLTGQTRVTPASAEPPEGLCCTFTTGRRSSGARPDAETGNLRSAAERSQVGASQTLAEGLQPSCLEGGARRRVTNTPDLCPWQRARAALPGRTQP